MNSVSNDTSRNEITINVNCPNDIELVKDVVEKFLNTIESKFPSASDSEILSSIKINLKI